MELPKRKRLRIKNYDYSRNGAYFITLCTYNRAHLFGEISKTTVGATLCGRPNHPDQMIKKWLYEIENKFENVKVDAFVVMPNHIHFILLLTGDHAGSPLPNVVDWLKTMTTNAYIKGVKDGLYEPFHKHVWQRNYYEHIIRNKDDLYEAKKYIIENPLKWAFDKYHTE